MLMAGQFRGRPAAGHFDEYYTKYFLPRWTLEKNIENLASKLPDRAGCSCGAATVNFRGEARALRRHSRSTTI